MIEISGHRVHSGHYVDGARHPETDDFEVFSPIDGAVLGRMSEASPEVVSAAVGAAEAAFPAWAGLGAEGRLPYLQRFAEEIGARADALAEAESHDAGILVSRMRHGIVPRAMQNIGFFAEAALTLQDRTMETPQATHHVRHDPAGVCAIITPWNSPLMLGTWKLGPALAAGNTCLLKAPEWAPLSSSIVADAAHAAGLPAGVFNVLQGAGATTGAALVADPRLSRISFTGSTATGKLIGQLAMGNLVPCSLELGGKSPFVVLEDADLDLAARTGALMYRNATQVCLAGTRLLVHAAVRDEFVERMGACVAELVVGDPRDAATEVGPLIHPRQYDRVVAYVDAAVERGARVLWGGSGHDFGDLYYTPTLLTDLAPDDPIVQEEVFGPVLVLQTFEDDDEAVALANDTRYGLGGLCFGETAHAQAVAERVRTGFIWVNSFGIRDLAAPFGGCRESGIGREGGDWSFEFFSDVKDVIVPAKPFTPSFAHR
jgi:5-carboxymethyl-2-hydroxymuconic-semialdehyde dehydrogenase